MTKGKGKGKGKEKASSSGRDAKLKRQRMNEQAREPSPPPGPRPVWQGGLLNTYDIRWQSELFHEKVADQKDQKDAFICETQVSDPRLGDFGLYEKFEALGWSAALQTYDNERNQIYEHETLEWIASLECPKVDNPRDMQLIGAVNGTEVVMSFKTLSEIADFDNNPNVTYVYPPAYTIYEAADKDPRWLDMVNTLFRGRGRQTTLRASSLRIQAKMLYTICLKNVMPRRGDTSTVRNFDIPVLYALFTGSPAISFRYLVMNNIWYSRNDTRRRSVSHTRLITALLKKHGVIPRGAVGTRKIFKSRTLEDMGSGWKYERQERHHVLKADGFTWTVRRGDVEEEEGDEGEDEVIAEENRVEPEDENVEMGGQSGYMGSAFDYAHRDFDTDWAFHGSMNQVIEQARPPVFGEWPDSSQMMFDHMTYMGASQERAWKRSYDRNEQWNNLHAYAFQQEINDRREDDRRRRAREDYLMDQPVVTDPPVLDYSTLPPYDGHTYYPVPSLHQSRWLDPNQGGYGGSGSSQASGDAGQGSSGGDGAFNFGGFSDLMSSIFGPPRPPYP